MAIVFLESGSSGFDATKTGDFHILAKGRYLANTGDAFDFKAFAGTLIVDGQIYSELDGIDADTGTGSVKVTVNSTGSVSGDSDGIELAAGNSRVVNHGDITALGDNGVELESLSYSRLTNTGQIVGANAGVRIGITARINAITNSGHISGPTGLNLGQTTTIVNTGEIIGNLPASTLDTNYGIRASGTVVKTITVKNSGTISGLTAAYLSEVGTTEVMTNSGVFDGAVTLGDLDDSYRATSTGQVRGALDAGTGNDTIVNRGSIDGNVTLGEGDDQFDGRGGTVTGTVDGGDGQDTYVVDDATLTLVEAETGGTDLVQSSVSWELGEWFENLDLRGTGAINGIGNALNNTINGSAGDNRITGLAGDDTINGKAGDDDIRGGSGADTILGGSGDDILRGQSGNDSVRGGDGDDRLFGNGGRDRLYGDAGRDTLVAGEGSDFLFGGTDEDLFVFHRASDSPDDANRVRIQDFQIGIDRIDLRGVATGSLTFIAGGAFSGTGPEVNVTLLTTATEALRVDVDGDGVADMRVELTGVTGLTADDILL